MRKEKPSRTAYKVALNILTLGAKPEMDEVLPAGIVDSTDVCIVVDNWGTDNSICDIGPMPWGDGTVDVQDLIVLAEHLFEEYPPAEPVE